MKKIDELEKAYVKSLLPLRIYKKTRAKHIKEVARLIEQRDNLYLEGKDEQADLLQDQILKSYLYEREGCVYCRLLQEMNNAGRLFRKIKEASNGTSNDILFG